MQLPRLLRTHLAHRSAAHILLVVSLTGLLSLLLATLASAQRERAQQQQLLEELVGTVENTLQIACFVNNLDLADEVAGGLMGNRMVGHVRIRSEDGWLVEAGAPVAAGGRLLVKPIFSPFIDGELICSLELAPNPEQIRQIVTQSSLFVAVLLLLQIIAVGALVVLISIRLILRPITRLARRLRSLQAEQGERLEVPPGHDSDELGRLVGSVNGLIERLLQALRAERELRQQREIEERRFRTIFDSVEAGIFEVSPDGQLLSANPAFRRLFAIDPQHDLQRRPLWLGDLAGEARDAVEQGVQRLAADEALAAQRIQVLVKSDRPRWIDLLLSRVEAGHLQGVANDVSEQHQAALAAERMAQTDNLTELGNRRGLLRRLQDAEQLLRADPDYRASLIMLDLDRFKAANDTYGHAIGDRVLQQVARILTGLVRQQDYVARLGGDEFVVLLQGRLEQERLHYLLQRILQQINQPMQFADDIRVEVGASLGVAILGEDAASAEALLKCADTAMYAAKDAGRNCWRFSGQRSG